MRSEVDYLGAGACPVPAFPVAVVGTTTAFCRSSPLGRCLDKLSLLKNSPDDGAGPDLLAALLPEGTAGIHGLMQRHQRQRQVGILRPDEVARASADEHPPHVAGILFHKQSPVGPTHIGTQRSGPPALAVTVTFCPSGTRRRKRLDRSTLSRSPASLWKGRSITSTPDCRERTMAVSDLQQQECDREPATVAGTTSVASTYWKWQKVMTACTTSVEGIGATELDDLANGLCRRPGRDALLEELRRTVHALCESARAGKPGT